LCGFRHTQDVNASGFRAASNWRKQNQSRNIGGTGFPGWSTAQ
jgi:hypothetical protein